jgi:hypothetical protein
MHRASTTSGARSNSGELDGFIRSTVRSLWELEALLVLSGDHCRTWSADELALELGAGPALVAGILAKLRDLGIARQKGERFRCDPASADLRRAVDQLRAAYAARPLAIAKAITAARSEKIQTIADAFRIRPPKRTRGPTKVGMKRKEEERARQQERQRTRQPVRARRAT